MICISQECEKQTSLRTDTGKRTLHFDHKVVRVNELHEGDVFKMLGFDYYIKWRRPTGFYYALVGKGSGINRMGRGSMRMVHLLTRNLPGRPVVTDREPEYKTKQRKRLTENANV